MNHIRKLAYVFKGDDKLSGGKGMCAVFHTLDPPLLLQLTVKRYHNNESISACWLTFYYIY